MTPNRRSLDEEVAWKLFEYEVMLLENAEKEPLGDLEQNHQTETYRSDFTKNADLGVDCKLQTANLLMYF